MKSEQQREREGEMGKKFHFFPAEYAKNRKKLKCLNVVAEFMKFRKFNIQIHTGSCFFSPCTLRPLCSTVY